ncbi:hypothetical protein [Nonomuraea rosea]|uniref:hypothetical protein n=1 Tax=Nonomuraea rosea TaxID=638574 RepID=UPI0031F14507
MGTIRAEKPAQLTGQGEPRDPTGEALHDDTLVTQIDWARDWSEQERQRLPEHVTNPSCAKPWRPGRPWASGPWPVPQLVRRLREAQRSQHNYPYRAALPRAVLDWYRTGLTTPLPQTVAHELLLHSYQVKPSAPTTSPKRSPGCTHAPDLGGRTAHYSLLSAGDQNALHVNDCIHDHDGHTSPPPIPAPAWETALAHAPTNDAIFSVGASAYDTEHTRM